MTGSIAATIERLLAQPHVHLVGRGTTALWAAVRALAPAGSEVLVPANACEVVAAAVRYAQRTIRYVDVDPIEGNCTVEYLAAAWRPTCKTLIAIHNYGTPLDMDTLVAWARAHGVAVIEDCCNALGATWRGQPVGTFGDVAVHSFNRGKLLDIGSGGALASSDPALIDECARLAAAWRPWGDAHTARDRAFQECLRVIRRHRELRDPAIYETLYERYRPALLATAPDDLDDAVARAACGFGESLARRRARAEHCRARLTHPAVRHRIDAGDAYWRYTCHIPRTVRDAVVADVRARGLPISSWFSALHRFFPTQQSLADLPGAYAFEKSVINLFVGSDTDDETLDATCDAVLAVLDARVTAEVLA